MQIASGREGGALVAAVAALVFRSSCSGFGVGGSGFGGGRRSKKWFSLIVAIRFIRCTHSARADLEFEVGQYGCVPAGLCQMGCKCNPNGAKLYRKWSSNDAQMGRGGTNGAQMGPSEVSVKLTWAQWGRNLGQIEPNKNQEWRGRGVVVSGYVSVCIVRGRVCGLCQSLIHI